MLKFGTLRRGKQTVRHAACLFEAFGAKIILPTLEHRIGKTHRQDRLEHGKVLLYQLLLQVDGVRADDGFFTCLGGEENGWNQIGKAFTHASPRLHNEMFAVNQGFSDRAGHGLLLGSVFEVSGLG